MTWQGCPLQVKNSPLQGDLGLTWVKCSSKWGLGPLEIESAGDACEESDSWDPHKCQLLMNSGGGRERGVAWECACYQRLSGDSWPIGVWESVS